MFIRRDVSKARFRSLAYASSGAAVGVAWLAFPFVIPPTAPQIDQLITASFFSVIGWLLFKARRARVPRSAVVWLRRFHVEAPPRYPFERLAQRLSEHGIVACTLRDSKVRTSDFTIRAFKRDHMPEFNKRAHRSLNWWGLRLAISGVAVLALLLLSGLVLVPRLGVSPAAAGVLIISAGAATFVFLTVRHLNREKRVWNEMLDAYLNEMRIDEQELTDIKDTMQRIAAGQGLRAGVYVFDVVDAAWQQAVTSLSSEAEAALFDVSELTQNLRFELEVLANQFPAEAVVVAWAAPNTQTPQSPPQDVVLELERAFGAGAWRRFKKLPYRHEVTGLSRLLAPMADTRRARELLYDAIDARRTLAAAKTLGEAPPKASAPPSAS